MYIFISGFKRLDGQAQAWVKDVINLVYICAYKTMQRKKGRSRNEAVNWIGK